MSERTQKSRFHLGPARRGSKIAPLLSAVIDLHPLCVGEWTEIEVSTDTGLAAPATPIRCILAGDAPLTFLVGHANVKVPGKVVMQFCNNGPYPSPPCKITVHLLPIEERPALIPEIRFEEIKAMNVSTAPTRRDVLGARIREIDERLEKLRPRLASLLEEIVSLIDKENRNTRLFAESDDKKEKQRLDGLITEIVGRRSSLQRECKGLAICLEELEANRMALYPEFQELLATEQKETRRLRLEELRQQHHRDQEREQMADQALAEAREKSNRSYFALRAELDQEALNAQAEALNRQKELWAERTFGPKAPNRRNIN